MVRAGCLFTCGGPDGCGEQFDSKFMLTKH
jgi:hypothetical protein